MTISHISVYIDFKQDESYTPSRFRIRAGTCFQDLEELCEQEVGEISGWLEIPLFEDLVKKCVFSF